MASSGWKMGPAALIAAAFVGPGTITVCTLAGAASGYALLWALLLSIIATLILQGMAARLGLITGKDLSANMRDELAHNKLLRGIVLAIVISAIVFGNAAYEAGNLAGGAVGLDLLLGEGRGYAAILGLLAFALLWLGNYQVLERVLVVLVTLMGLSFICVAIITDPDWSAVFSGLFVPSWNAEQFILILGLVGTTVVPYNLFLHASLVREKWQGAHNLPAVRRDSLVSIVLGGVFSMAIVIAAARLQGQDVSSGRDLVQILEPLYGKSATIVFGIGMLAAGLTSAITAPLAAAYVARGCMGWKAGLTDKRFRAVWIGVLTIGILVSSTGVKPIEIIKFAQVSNGLLLPLMAGILLWLVNKAFMGVHKNSMLSNVSGAFVIVISLVLGVKGVAAALNLL